jgi:glutathione S-transferase
MTTPILVIGNKAYSSWSLRPWLLLRHFDIPFREVTLPLYTASWKAEIEKYSPSGKVPVLIDGDLRVWDSLAICEYLAEAHPDRKLWPQARSARAAARAVSAEMHSGFRDLRNSMPMNVRRTFPGRGRNPATVADITRICSLWDECRIQFGRGGAFLFGDFCIADAMYAPVASRFRTYAIELDPAAQAYVDAIHRLPAMQRWIAEAAGETEVIEQYET